jgi:hypothetical protein
VLIMAVYGAYHYGPLPGAREPNLDMITKPYAHKESLNMFFSTLRQEESIAASNAMGAHLSRRERIYVLPFGVDIADVVIFSLHDGYNQPSQAWHEEKVSEMRMNPAYRIVYEKDGVVAFQKK